MTIHKKNLLVPASLSFQLMTRSEPPELVIATIQSLLAIKEATDEILIIDNNNTIEQTIDQLKKVIE